jgi:CRP/FNR family transcriptional regulator, cyclic AMP receptor protein
MNLVDILIAHRWARDLPQDILLDVSRSIEVRKYGAGALVCQADQPVDAWIGVIDGMLKIVKNNYDGRITSLAGVSTGGWFGEGSLLKDELRRYSVSAITPSHVAFMPKRTFMMLLDTQISFNRIIIEQLNERLGQFIGSLERERLLDPDARVARTLASFFNPILYPGQGARLEISQEELGYFAGVSRQRVNQALRVLEGQGLIKLEYGAIIMLNLVDLQFYGA